jgi:iron-sulfur cluster assembly protein
MTTAQNNQLTISLTPAAVSRAKFLLNKQGHAQGILRIGVKGGGCSGLSYIMRPETEPKPNDHILDFDGLRVAVDPKSAKFLNGLSLDFSLAKLLEGGWIWNNPNAQKSCGCGTSFTPKPSA